MEQTEYLSRIARYRSRLKRYNAIFSIVRSARFFASLLVCVPIYIVARSIIRGALHPAAIVPLLAWGVTFAALLVYCDRLKSKISRASDIIANYKKNSDRMSDIAVSFPETEIEFLYHEYTYAGDLAGDPDITQLSGEVDAISQNDDGFQRYFDQYKRQTIPDIAEDNREYAKRNAIKFLLM